MGKIIQVQALDGYLVALDDNGVCWYKERFHDDWEPMPNNYKNLL